MPLARGRVVRRSGRLVATALLIAVALSGVVLLTPTALGGSTAYVVTDGTSMLPTFRAGGVVLTRERDRYAVGDVIAYRNPDLEAVVLHRVIARRGDRFVAKGDNNDYVDEFRPTPADVVGKEWLYLPGAGSVLAELRTPAVFGGLLALIVLVGLRPGRARGRSRRGGHGRRRR